MQEKLYDLTNPQKSIWFTEEIYKGTAIANISGTANISEKVNFQKLEKAINLFVQKNDGFRLKFTLEDGNVKQFLSTFTKFNISKTSVYEENDVKELEKKISRNTF